MANIRALTFQSGNFQQIQDANTTIVGAGVTTSAGAVAITSATGAVNVGTVAALSKVLGNFQTDGTSALVGITTATGAIYANGGVDRSAAATLSLGTANASAISIGRTGIDTTLTGANFLINATSGTTATRDSIANAQTFGLKLLNNTAAAAGAGNQQWSPGLQLSGHQFNGADKAVDGILQLRALEASTNAAFTFQSRYDGGAWTSICELTVGPFGAGAIRGGVSTGTIVEFNTSLIFSTASGLVLPAAANTERLGSNANYFVAVDSAFYDTKMGTQLTAAATITPTSGFHHVTGATTIDNIAATNLPASSNPSFIMVADSALISWSAAGNIAAAGTLAQFFAQPFQYDVGTSKWYPVL